MLATVRPSSSPPKETDAFALALPRFCNIASLTPVKNKAVVIGSVITTHLLNASSQKVLYRS